MTTGTFEPTIVHGEFHHLIKLSGGITAEFTCLFDNINSHVLLFFSDGTILEARSNYKPRHFGWVWRFCTVRLGDRFQHIEGRAERGIEWESDVVHFKPGLNFVYCVKSWELAGSR